MMREGRIIGELAVFAPPGRNYGHGELEAVFAVADLAAIAVSNLHHIQEIDRRRREAERLEEIGRALVASLDLNEVLTRVVSAAISLFDAGGATVWLLDKVGDNVHAAFTMGTLAPRRGLSMPAPEDLVRRMNEPSALVIDDAAHAELLPEAMRAMVRAASTMAVPLHDEDRLIGALSIAHASPRRYQPEDVRLLERLAIHAAIALSNARLHEEIRALSLTDPLTGLPNRRHLEMFLEREFAAAIRGRPLALLIFDLDNFKDYNDFAGHHAGDQALRAVGQLLASETRRMNLAARWGGDEFVAVLSGTDANGALLHAGRITSAIETHPVLGPLGIRASIGIAQFDARMGMPADLIAAADRDMYARKANRER
jgi:diguanylate cyclase (GGDEF)-like protein